MTRKEQLERIAIRAKSYTSEQQAYAWRCLMEELWVLSDPSGPPLPKFKHLMLAILRSRVRAQIYGQTIPSRNPDPTCDGKRTPEQDPRSQGAPRQAIGGPARRKAGKASPT